MVVQKDKHLNIAFEAIRSKLQITIDEMNASGHPRLLLTDEMLAPYNKNAIEVLSVQTKPNQEENAQQELIDLAAYHKFLGHRKFRDLIRDKYFTDRIPKVGDTVICKKDNEYCIGFVNMVRETAEKTFNLKRYITIVISYLGENGTLYTECSIHKVLKNGAVNRLAMLDMLFGRPYEECSEELATESKFLQEENKRRSKKKIITVGEYEDMLQMLEKLVDDVRRLNDKIPYRHTLGPG